MAPGALFGAVVDTPAPGAPMLRDEGRTQTGLDEDTPVDTARVGRLRRRSPRSPVVRGGERAQRTQVSAERAGCFTGARRATSSSAASRPCLRAAPGGHPPPRPRDGLDGLREAGDSTGTRADASAGGGSEQEADRSRERSAGIRRRCGRPRRWTRRRDAPRDPPGGPRPQQGRSDGHPQPRTSPRGNLAAPARPPITVPPQPVADWLYRQRGQGPCTTGSSRWR